MGKLGVVIDYMMPHSRDWLAAIKADHPEVIGVARYLDPYNPKCLQPGEVADVFALGLELHLVFEIGGAGPWTEEEGEADLLAALALVERELPGRKPVVYFAADRNDVVDVFDPYANGIYAAKARADTAGVIDPGIYGFENLIKHAWLPKDGRAHNYPFMSQHLWQTYGETAEAEGVPLDMRQREQVTWHGVDVDLNDAYVHGLAGGDDVGLTGEQVKDVWREMAQSDEGAVLVKAAILHPGGYGQALEVELEALRQQAAAAGAPIDEAQILRDATANIIAKLSA